MHIKHTSQRRLEQKIIDLDEIESDEKQKVEYDDIYSAYAINSLNCRGTGCPDLIKCTEESVVYGADNLKSECDCYGYKCYLDWKKQK